MTKKRIILYSKSDIIRLGLERLFAQHNDIIEIVKSVSSNEQLQEAIIGRTPQLILIDPALSGSSTASIISNIRKQYPAIAITALLCSYTDKATLSLFDSVIELHDNLETIIESITNTINSNDTPSTSTGNNEELSARENDIVALVAKGLTNKEIAENLNISIHTVITHRKNISKKTGIKSISGLTMYAILNKLI